MAVPPEVESLPEWGQKILGGLAFLGVVGAMVTRFLGNPKQDQDDHKTVVLERAETADLGILRKLIADLEPLPDLIDEIRRVISNQDRNFGLLDRMTTSLDKVASKVDQSLENQGRVIATIDRAASQTEAITVVLKKLVDMAERQERSREMREEMERIFKRSESQVPPTK